MLLRICARQNEGEDSSLPFLAFHDDPGIVSFDDLTHYRKPEAAGADRPARSRIDLIPALEQVRKSLAGYPDAGVPYLNLDGRCLLLKPNRYAAAGRRI